MPKQRITREMVVDAAFALARNGGMEQVTVKGIADRLGCSVQPIYSYCESMDGLRRAVTERIRDFIKDYIAQRVQPDDLFRSTGRAYLRLTQDEPQLFKILVFHQRRGVTSLDELYHMEAGEEMAGFLARRLHISPERAKRLHLDMLIYTIGIGTIFSVSTPGISPDEILAQQERAYQIFLRNALEGRDETEDTGVL